MYRCEICGKAADIHHIVYRSEGGLNFPVNYKYLCPEHHRGKYGPHRDKTTDLKYKLEMQGHLERILEKPYYKSSQLMSYLGLNNGSVKRLIKDLKCYKEGYKSTEIIFKLMGNKRYDEAMYMEYEDLVMALSL